MKTNKKQIDKHRVYDYLTTIPKGKVVTYGQIAQYMGNKNYARTIGNILHENPDGDQYPCYKVVNARGMLSEHYAFGGIQEQCRRLQAEGVVVEHNWIDLKRYQMNS